MLWWSRAGDSIGREASRNHSFPGPPREESTPIQCEGPAAVLVAGLEGPPQAVSASPAHARGMAGPGQVHGRGVLVDDAVTLRIVVFGLYLRGC